MDGASQANRQMIFYRFNDKSLARSERIVKKFSDQNVGAMFGYLSTYQDMLFKQGIEMEFFDFLLDVELMSD